MSYTEDQLWSLLREANEMPYGAARIALVEQVIAHADAAHAQELRFRARMVATGSYTHGGEPGKSFVTFSWCLAEYDRDPHLYRNSTHTIMWHFKYMVSALRKFPEIPLDRTYAVLDDMERRWRDGGHSMQTVYAYRHSIAQHIGDHETAERYYGQWCTAPRDDLSDCIGCDPSSKAYWLAERHRDEDAIAIAEPVLAGAFTCTEQPQSILTALLLPYLRTGRIEEARDAHRRAYRLQRSNLSDMQSIATHIQFCAMTGNEPRGLEIVQRHLPWLDTPPSPYAAMHFAAASALVLDRLRERGHGDVMVARPAHGDRAEVSTTVAALADQLAAVATGLAARFDERNGTDHQSVEIADILATEPVVDALPLTVSAQSPVPDLPRPVPVEAEAVAPADNAAAPAVPSDATIDELLDLAEDHLLFDRNAEAVAVEDAFNERFAGAELTDLQRGRRADLHGLVAANDNDLGVAEVAWNSALGLFASGGDEVRRQTTRARIGMLMCRTGRAEIGLPITQDATDYLVNHASIDRMAGVHRRMAFTYLMSGRVDDALASLEVAATLVEHSRDPLGGVKLSVERAGLLAEAGRIDEAGTAAEAARIACREFDHQSGLATACWIAGRVSQSRQDFDAALSAYDEALTAVDNKPFEREIRRQRASMLAGSGRAAEAIDDLVEELAVATADGENDVAMTARYHLAMAYLNGGRPLDAADLLEELLAGLGAEDPAAESVRHMLAQSYRALDQPDQAIEQLELVAESGARRAHPALVAEMSEQIGQLLDRLDRDALAAQRFGAASVAYAQADMPLESLRTARRCALSHMWAGQLDEATEALEKADLAALDITAGSPAIRWERTMLGIDGARILAQRGDLDAAIFRSAPMIDAFTSIGDTSAAAFAAAIHGGLLVQAGRHEQAEPVLRLAIAGGDDDARRRAAHSLARALDMLGRTEEAAEIRAAHEMDG